MRRNSAVQARGSERRASQPPVAHNTAAMTAALQTISQRNADRLDSAVRVISAYLAALPPAARGAFADRLEKILTRDREKDMERAKADKG